MEDRFRRVEQIEQQVQMLLDLFSAYSVRELLLQRLDTLEQLEQEVVEKGRVSEACWTNTLVLSLRHHRSAFPLTV